MGARDTRRLSRRRFLGEAALAAASAALASCRPLGEAVGLYERAIPGELLGPSAAFAHRLRDGAVPVAAGAEERAAVVIVGGGVAGLSAGWALRRAGFDDFVVLDLEARAGGNSAWGENEVSAYPWGAHYLPIPGPEAKAVRRLLRELKVITGEERGEPVYDERVVCHAPEERLFLHGRWQEGLYPRIAATAEDLAEKARFDRVVAAHRRRRGRDGRRAFAIPLELSSRDPDLLALDALSMEAWLDREGFRSARLRWFVEYATRDDYGATLAETSAWAGLHYFCAREEDERLLVWPEGNGFLVRRLAEGLGPRVRTGALAYEVAPEGDGVRVDWLDAATGAARRLRAKRAIVCVPRFVARRIVVPLRGRPDEGFAYAPWFTANLTVQDPPHGTGAAPAWDSVIHGVEGLGVVDATHQSLSLDRRRAVWTYYRPLTGDPAARRKEARARTLDEWRALAFAELEPALPGLKKATTRFDGWVWGHGMIRPGPGFVWGAARRGAARPLGPIHFAHSDLSGLSIFEEAQYRGIVAAESALAALGAPYSSAL